MQLFSQLSSCSNSVSGGTKKHGRMQPHLQLLEGADAAGDPAQVVEVENQRLCMTSIGRQLRHVEQAIGQRLQLVVI